jgi:cell division protein FtsZ
MNDDLSKFELPVNKSSKIKVIGVGGGGSNAVSHMYNIGIESVDFIVCNTDAQALIKSPVPVKIQLGQQLTEGRGSDNNPSVGHEAAIESLDDVVEILTNHTRMVLIIAAMGGGTGTGAAPVIAKAAKELGILTVAIVTLPFRMESQRRMDQALKGIADMEHYVDSLLIINNQRILHIYGDLKVSEIFAKADDVLAIAAKGIAEMITLQGYVNVDFADVETVMSDSGVAIMGSGRAIEPDRAVKAVTEALKSPLLNDTNIQESRNILLTITSGVSEVTLDEIGQITDYIQRCAGDNVNLIWGNGVDEKLGDALSVTVIATGFGRESIPELNIRSRRPDIDEASQNLESIGPSYFDVHESDASSSSTKEEFTIESQSSQDKQIIKKSISSLDRSLFRDAFEKLFDDEPIPEKHQKQSDDRDDWPSLGHQGRSLLPSKSSKDSQVTRQAYIENDYSRSEIKNFKARTISEEVYDELIDSNKNQIDCTVFSPPKIEPGEIFLIQVFAHLIEKTEEAEKMAKEFDDDTVRRGFTSLTTAIELNSSLHFEVILPGVMIDNPVQLLRWRGRTESVTFEVFFPKGIQIEKLIGKVIVSQNSIPLGLIRFIIKVQHEENTIRETQSLAPTGEARHFEKAFISYASQDRSEVLRRVQMLSATRIKFFQDILTLEPGDRWAKQIYRHIDDADVFFLFWSQAAKKSEWVLKETLYALEKKSGNDLNPPEIVPILLEKPVPDPPDELKDIHFNDKFIYFIDNHQSYLSAPVD